MIFLTLVVASAATQNGGERPLGVGVESKVPHRQTGLYAANHFFFKIKYRVDALFEGVM